MANFGPRKSTIWNSNRSHYVVRAIQNDFIEYQSYHLSNARTTAANLRDRTGTSYLVEYVESVFKDGLCYSITKTLIDIFCPHKQEDLFSHVFPEMGVKHQEPST